MEITITLINGETRLLTVPPHTTVGSLKSQIKESFNVSTAELKLSAVNGNKFSLSEDSKTLIDYGLHSGSKVMVLITAPIRITPIQVFLKIPTGQIHTYEVAPDETVTKFKEKVHNKERVPANQQWLTYNAKQLEDGKKLENYGVRDKSTINLNLRVRGG